MFQKLKIENNAYTIITNIRFPQVLATKMTASSSTANWILGINIFFVASGVKLSHSWMQSIYFVHQFIMR